MTFALLLLVAYLLGAIPVGVLVARSRGIDILKEGSGNIGATNVGRVLGKGPGLAVWGLDVMKSLVPTLVARALIHDRLGPLDAQTQWFLVGTAAILGHCASPFLGFKGGKGISTALGAILGAAPLVALLCFGLFALVLGTTRYMAIASTVGVSSVVLFAWLLGVTPQLLPVFALLALFVAYRHRSNFARLRAGTEPRFSFKGGGTRAEGGEDSTRSGAAATDPSALLLNGNAQLPDPQSDDPNGFHSVQIVNSVLSQFLNAGSYRADLSYERATSTFEPGSKPYDLGCLKIQFDGKDNGQLPMELAVMVLRRLSLLAGMDLLKEKQAQSGRITGTYGGEAFELLAESSPPHEGVVFSLTRPPSQNP